MRSGDPGERRRRHGDARGGDSFGAALRALRADDYRKPAVSPDRLWATLEHAGTSFEGRIGAALVLRPSLDDEDVERLRRFARSCVSPGLRGKLEVVAEDNPLERA